MGRIGMQSFRHRAMRNCGGEKLYCAWVVGVRVKQKLLNGVVSEGRTHLTCSGKIVCWVRNEETDISWLISLEVLLKYDFSTKYWTGS